jgi:hypothetical protein
MHIITARTAITACFPDISPPGCGTYSFLR